jgi:hypothetical protein
MSLLGTVRLRGASSWPRKTPPHRPYWPLYTSSPCTAINRLGFTLWIALPHLRRGRGVRIQDLRPGNTNHRALLLVLPCGTPIAIWLLSERHIQRLNQARQAVADPRVHRERSQAPMKVGRACPRHRACRNDVRFSLRPTCTSDRERAIKHSWATGVGLCEKCPDSRQCETNSSMRAIGCPLSLHSMMGTYSWAGPEATPSSR